MRDLPFSFSAVRSAALVLSALLLTPLGAGAQSDFGNAAAAVSKARSYRQANELRIVEDLKALVSIPNFAEDAEDIRRNANDLMRRLREVGASARLLEAPGSPPAVLGELPASLYPATAKTVVLYAHYDGQPVDPERWASSPYVAELRTGMESDARVIEVSLAKGVPAMINPEWRLFGRSASDDKAPIIAMLHAVKALQVAGIERSVNLKFFFEGEEERGSPHLADMLSRHQQLLDADLWLFCDGPVHQSRQQQVVFGVRGVMGVGVTLYGPNRPLHSGHYGNWAPNPAARLAELIATMRDGEGRILIDGFYDKVRPLSAADRAAIDSAPAIDADLRRDLDIARSENDNAPLLERILLPALNVQGLSAGMVGDRAQNAVPSVARAALGFRLVPDLLPEDVHRLVEAHLEALDYVIVDRPPTQEELRTHPKLIQLEWEGGYRATRTSLDGPISEALLTVVDAVVAAQSQLNGAGPNSALRLPLLGGSLPLYLFEEILETPLVVLPMVNHDNNQHAPNENLRIQNLWDGIELYAGVIAELGSVWN